ncbi:hypothetical protein HDU67_000665 [Dinochytrium kinnereticum]|nr:hypothetical protein HDU67_000665 [Dinochytrium kinnereticum]
MGDLPECCRTGFLWNGTPSGSITTLGGVETYIAKPEKPTTKYVVIWTDVFGHKNPNARLIADSIAKAGFHCVVPDILSGDAVDYNQLESLSVKPQTYVQRFSQLLKSLYIAPGFIGWILRHSEKTTMPFINAVLNDLKDNHGATKIGVIGFCFGGRYSVMCGGDEPRVDAFVAAHPSLMSIPKDIEAIKKPGLFLLASEDQFLSNSQVETIRKITSPKENVTVKVFPNTLHGFAIRGNEGDENTRNARDEAMNDTTSFFLAHL